MGDFTAVVRRFMTMRGMSLRETARAAGYSDHTLLSKALNGHKPVTPYLAASLDEALDAGGEIIAAARSAQAVAEAAGLPLRELADHAAEFGAWAETGAGLFDCGAVRLAGYQATLGLREGSLAAVLVALAGAEHAVSDGEEVPYASLAQVRLCAALALLASGDADQAAGQLSFVLGLPAEMRLATFGGRLSQAAALASAAPYQGSVVAGQIADDVAGYLGADPAPVPPPLAIDAASVR
jgi:hypothetical protein